MGKSLTEITKGIRLSLRKHSPEILTGLGIAGMVTTTVMAVGATPKALLLIEEEKRKQNRILLEEGEARKRIEKLKPLDVVKTTWRCYLPSAIMCGVSIGCLICASQTSLRRNAALATAYTLSESALKEYQEKVAKEIGEKKEQAVRDSIAKDKVEQNPASSNEIIITERGSTLCYDIVFKRWFTSDIEKIKRAVNDLNRRMRDEMYISVNEFFYELGLDGIKYGDDMGWNIDTGYIDLDFSSQLTDEGRPVLTIDYRLAPTYDFR